MSGAPNLPLLGEEPVAVTVAAVGLPLSLESLFSLESSSGTEVKSPIIFILDLVIILS